MLPLLALAFSAGAANAGEIRGRLLVSDHTDKPAGGLTVSAVPWETPGDEARRSVKGSEAPKTIASAVTGADGSFLLSVGPEPGKERTFRVKVEGPGVVPVLFEDVYDSAEIVDLGEHTLPHGEKLTGVATDASGKPLAGAEVSLEAGVEGGDDLGFRVLARKVVTGEDGRFQFDEASAQGNRITIEKADLAPKRETGLKSGAIPRPIAVVAGDPVGGVVLGAGHKPVGGALVRLESVKATTRWVETDAEGRFTIPHAPDGRGSIVVDAGDAGWGRKPDVKLPLGEGKTLTITLALPASLDGKVVDDRTGRLVPRAKVFAKGNGFARLVRTGPDGMYHLKGIPPGTYRLTVDEARCVPWMKPDLALAPGEGKRLDIAVTLGASIAGRVVDENGAPVASARGTLISGGENALQGIRRMLRAGGETTAFRTRPDGTFAASRLAPGDNQRLFVSHADFERATLAGLSLPSGGTKGGVAVVMHRGATISGVVKDADGQPIADVEVQVDPSVSFRGGAGGLVANFARLGGPGVRPKTKTGPDGTFQIKGISVGEYALQIRKPGFANERVDPVKVTDKGADPVAVTLGPGASISGILRRRSGEGAEGFFVRVGAGGRGAGGGGGPLGGTGTSLPTGPDGLFVLDGLKPGHVYDLSVFGGAGLGPQKRGVVAPASNVEIQVAGTGRIAGTVLDARSGQPLKSFSASYEPDRGGGAIIRLVARGAGGQTGIGQKREFNAEDGAFTLEDVPAGTWTVVVEAKGYLQARVASLVVEEGGAREGVEVRATPGVVLKGHVSDARSGRAVANASITHEPAGGGGPGGFGGFGGRGGAFAALGGSDDVTSDAEGNFEIDGISAGRIKVTAKSPDYTDGSEVVDVKETGGTVEIKLTAGGSAGGVVVAGSQPLANAQVSLAVAGDAGFGRLLGGGQTTTTDAAGRFR
ncbi:MAG: carboxypeptidase regulatory-like domain-containing protein, partial [Acidobacteriota bacterium]